MKKLLLLLTVACGFCMVGCATTRVSGSHKTLGFANNAKAETITADVVVSEQRVEGEAEGFVWDERLLMREAIAKAFGAVPTTDTPDLLMARETYIERDVLRFRMRVVVSGYPAWYRNIRNVPAIENDPAFLVITNQDATGAEAR